jgi:hypothetical protein
MTTHRVDALARSLTTSRSRRSALGGLLLGTVGLLGWADTQEAAAKTCKKIKDKKKRKACQKKATGTTDQLPGDPASQTIAVTCPRSTAALVSGAQRFAHTFTAPISGQLTSAQVEITSVEAGNDYTVEIRPLDGAGVPTASVLASARIENVAGNSQTLTATFAAPPAVQTGTGYAVVMTEERGSFYALRIRAVADCSGQLFSDRFANNTFSPINTAAMIFSVTIVG